MTSFSHRIFLKDLEKGAVHLTLTADAEVRRMLTDRFGLMSLEDFSGRLEVSATDDGMRVAGDIKASVIQECVVSLEPVKQTIAERFAVRFTRDPLPVEDDEIVIDPETEDVEPLEADCVDVAEVMAQTLSLYLDPYPRKETPISSKHILDESEARAREKSTNPFSILKKLRNKT